MLALEGYTRWFVWENRMLIVLEGCHGHLPKVGLLGSMTALVEGPGAHLSPQGDPHRRYQETHLRRLLRCPHFHRSRTHPLLRHQTWLSIWRRDLGPRVSDQQRHWDQDEW